MITALYTDGGTVSKNPSPIGGTWAWCTVDENGNKVAEDSGFVPAYNNSTISNNYTEFLALLNGLEAMEENWSGFVYCDSQLTLGRFFQGWRNRNIPDELVNRAQIAVNRLGKITPVLVSGHPTKSQLKTGLGKSGRPVSQWNAYVDELCSYVAANWGNKLMLKTDTLDDSSIFTREYKAKTKVGEVTFVHLDDMLEFIQDEMLTASDNTEILISLHRIESKDGKSI